MQHDFIPQSSVLLDQPISLICTITKHCEQTGTKTTLTFSCWEVRTASKAILLFIYFPKWHIKIKEKNYYEQLSYFKNSPCKIIAKT